MGDQDILVVLVERNFLKLGRLLAADTFSGAQSHDVAGLAEITDAINLSMMDGVDVVHLEIPICQKRAFQTDFVISKPLVPERLKNIVIAAGKRIFLRGGFHHRAGSVNEKKFPLQGLLTLDVCRPGRSHCKAERHSAQEEKYEAGMAQPLRDGFQSIRCRRS